MNQLEQKKRAQEFAEKWQGRGDEKQDAQNFWRDLLVNVLGVPSTSITSFISFERKVQGGFIDGFIEDTGVLIEQKSLGVDLTKAKPQSDGTNLTPYGQAVRYAAKLPLSIRPRWIICSNFEQFLIYDQETDPAGENPHVLMLADLPSEFYRLAFITDKSNSRLEKEKTLSVKAGAVVGKLYNSFAEQYQNIDTDEQEQKSLNVLIVRLVFLLYAEDAGLLQHHGALYDYLKPIPVPQMRQAIIDLFKVLNTPDGTGGTQDERDPYMNPELLAFPYINGGLFSDEALIIPQFTDQIKLDLLVEASSKFDWAEVSPTIFGAVFESTLNPETRHEGGMHYTSVENIHKVIDPLFLDELRGKLEKIEALKSDRDRRIRLKAFQNELASITVFDPACGSGNFLTESYLSLRKLENRVLENLQGEQTSFEVGGDSSIIKVKLSQFYGIEINDFAVSVAKTALWIAESQMIEATQEIVLQVLDFLPLTSNSNIVEGNALRMDWNDVVDSSLRPYICGNPPFIGQDGKLEQQREDMELVWGEDYDGYLDYVTGWYKKAADYFKDAEDVKFAFVSTNSICQGQPVSALFKPLFAAGWRIIFAWTTFIWTSEVKDKAHVHVVIVGMGKGIKNNTFMLYKDSECYSVTNINPYLADAEDFFIDKRTKPLSRELSPAVYGSKPADGGFLQIKDEATYRLAMQDPIAAKYVRRSLGATELINGKERWCLWLVDAPPGDIDGSPFLSERISNCKEWRLRSAKRQTNEAAQTPQLFVEIRSAEKSYLCLPAHFSGGREYFTADYVEDEAVATNACFMMEDSDGFSFAIISSSVFMLWQNTVGGRLKSDCRFANTLVWNTFPVPDMSDEQRREIVDGGKGVLEARRKYSDKTLADLYKPENFFLYPELVEAHRVLNTAVLRAYGLSDESQEGDIAAKLVELYSQMVGVKE